MRGGKVVTERNFINLKGIMWKIASEKATSFSAPPAVLKLLTENYPHELSACGTLKRIVTNTTHMPAVTSIRLLELLDRTRIYMYYGLTEASRSSFLLLNENRERLESVGKPAPNVHIKIADGHGKEAPQGEAGEIMIKGMHVAEGYWNNPEETARSMSGGWLRTGDMGYLDRLGFLWLAGRKDHMINVGGQKVSPHEIESVVSGMPGVKECAAVGLEDSLLSEVVRLFVVREGESPDTDEIIRICRARLENFKVPKRVDFVQSLPKTDTGKVRRQLLR
jgi:long-chain acyl-CoA synthetase